MDKVVISIVSGFEQGGTFALIALGLVLAFRATETFSFAHGQMMVLPSFIIGSLLGDDVALPVAILAGVAVSVAVAVTFQLVVLQRTIGQPLFIPVIATFGLAAILSGVIGIAFPGERNYIIDVPGIPDNVVEFLGARIRMSGVVIATATIALALLLAAFLRYTHLGMKLTAVGQDPVVASQGGIQVRRLHVLTWAIVAVLAAIAGIAQGATNGVGPSVAELGFLAFPALILGGLNSIGGTIVAGLTVGIVQGFTASYLGGDKVNVITYGLLLAIILLKPEGFFGIKNAARA